MKATIIYPPDDPLHSLYNKTRQYEYDIPPEVVHEAITGSENGGLPAERLLSHIWRQFNHVDGTEHITTANIQDRSMSVGDLVRFGAFQDTVFICLPVGWKRLEPSEVERVLKTDFVQRQLGKY
jgi:hypothetical protein